MTLEHLRSLQRHQISEMCAFAMGWKRTDAGEWAMPSGRVRKTRHGGASAFNPLEKISDASECKAFALNRNGADWAVLSIRQKSQCTHFGVVICDSSEAAAVTLCFLLVYSKGCE